MRPENLADIGSIIGPRIEDEGRARMLHEVNVAHREVVRAGEQAQRDIRDLYIMGNDSTTRLVVLENRTINDEAYSIVGEVRLTRASGGGGGGTGAVEGVVVQLGVAFDKPVGLGEASEQRLGESMDGRKWYGGWIHEESSDDIEEAKTAIDSLKGPSDSRLGLDDVSEYYDGAMKLLGSIKETLTLLVEAAQDTSLNPVKEEDSTS